MSRIPNLVKYRHLLNSRVHSTQALNYIISTTTAKRKMVNAATVSGLPLSDVINKLTGFASPSLAGSWDNVGLLVEPSSPHHVKHVFLTNDLTEAVMAEAIGVKADVIISYHPPIFSGIKRITQNKWKDRLVVKAMENRIAIYSPHTSWDVIKGGVNDWLVSCFHGDVQPITPLEGSDGFGEGRICTLKDAVDMNEVCDRVKQHLGLSHLRVALTEQQKKVKTIASCAGSGSSVLGGVKADVYLTGEMSHHEVLDAVSNKTNVILCEHSNTERGFLKTLVPTLTTMLNSQVVVTVSEKDKDPLEII